MPNVDMADDLYVERVSSRKTGALFIALAVIFFLLAAGCLVVEAPVLLSAVFAIFCAIFCFYSVNFRTLVIRLTPQSLKLNFGIFTWTTPYENVEDCALDELPAIMKYGGAGIHFMMIRGRYRASFNFLEYPRVVVAFRQKRGPVQALSFSTRQPEVVIRLIHEAVSANQAY